MPQIIFAPSALRDMERLRLFLGLNNPAAARRASNTIIKTVRRLGKYPQMGRPVDGMEPIFRELLIEFGDSGYLTLYRYDGVTVTILAIRHGREAGY